LIKKIYVYIYIIMIRKEIAWFLLLKQFHSLKKIIQQLFAGFKIIKEKAPLKLILIHLIGHIIDGTRTDKYNGKQAYSKNISFA